MSIIIFFVLSLQLFSYTDSLQRSPQGPWGYLQFELEWTPPTIMIILIFFTKSGATTGKD